MQGELKSPIHHRQKPDPFPNAPKRRRLSLTNHNEKDKQVDTIYTKQQNFWVNRIKRNKKKSTVSNFDSIESNYIKIELMREQQKSKWKTHPKNMLAFFPTYTTLVDNQAHNLYIHKTIKENDNNENADKQQYHSKKNRSAQRQKLLPLRKFSKKQSQNSSKDNLGLSFFNVEKVSLVPINSQTPNQSNRTKLSFTATVINNKRALIIPRQSFDQSTINQAKQQGKQQEAGPDSETTNFISKTFYNLKNQQSTANRIVKPFSPPFQRYYYFDFLWKIAYSNGLKAEFPENLDKKYKIFIGPGNNSMLIKTFFKRRQSWWAITQKLEEANFVWTQIKINNIHLGQKKSKNVLQNEIIEQKEKQEMKKNSFQYKRNSKILNPNLIQNWINYYNKNKDNEEKLAPNFSKRNRLLKTANFRSLQNEKIKIHNHFPRNYVLGNKKALFATMKKYYQCSKQQVFDYLPLTFHVENGLQDKQYFKFLQYFYQKSKQSKQNEKASAKNKIRNIWIVKPGEFTNRGNGITVCRTLEQVKNIVKYKKKLDNGNNRTYIVQEYLDRPFLYCKRKFDIRHYMLMTCVNGQIKGYWYQLGYIRTTSYQYSVKNSFSSVHLTNDAVQKNLPDYGKYEKGNKLSYDEFQKYLQREYEGRYSFYKTVYPKMRKIASDSIRASALLVDPERKQHNFEIFGFDFMIDSHFNVWLIEINTNPCLQLSSPVLMDVIPAMVENAIKISVDSVLLPPHGFTEKRPRFSQNVLQQNKFQLLFDSSVEQQKLSKLFEVGEQVKLNYKELQKDEDEVYEDDGVELDD